MALIREYTFSGISVPSAYFVISDLSARKRLLDTVPVELEPAVLDGEGNVVTPAVMGTQQVPSNKWDCRVVLSVFKDKAQRDAGLPPVTHLSDVTPDLGFTTTFEYDPLGSLPVVQGYEHLMAQAYFTGATVDTAS